METTEPTSSRDESAEAQQGDRATIPVPPLARAGIAEHQRHVAVANAALQAYLAGLAAGLGIPADRIAGIDVETWTIRLRADPPEAENQEDGHRRERAAPGA